MDLFTDIVLSGAGYSIVNEGIQWVAIILLALKISKDDTEFRDLIAHVNKTLKQFL